MRAIPPAVRAALGGRSGPLVRLRRTLLGTSDVGGVSEFSPALFATTTCEESPRAWDPAAGPAVRRSQARAPAAATPLTALYPFDRAAAIAGGLLSLCADWPAPARAVAPAPELTARIPALVLSGELDLRAPLEKARELARALPGARLVVERGAGHGVLGVLGSCADGAVWAFLDRRPEPRCVRRGAGPAGSSARVRSGRRRACASSCPASFTGRPSTTVSASASARTTSGPPGR